MNQESVARNLSKMLIFHTSLTENQREYLLSTKSLIYRYRRKGRPGSDKFMEDRKEGMHVGQ